MLYLFETSFKKHNLEDNAACLCSNFLSSFPLLKEATRPQCESTLSSCHDRLAYVNSFALSMFLFVEANVFTTQGGSATCSFHRMSILSYTDSLCDSFSSSFSKTLFPGSSDNGQMLFCIQWVWHSGRFLKRRLRNKWMDQRTRQSPFVLENRSPAAAGSPLGGDAPLCFHPESVSPSSTSPVWESDSRSVPSEVAAPDLCGLAPDGLL